MILDRQLDSGVVDLRAHVLDDMDHALQMAADLRALLEAAQHHAHARSADDAGDTQVTGDLLFRGARSRIKARRRRTNRAARIGAQRNAEVFRVGADLAQFGFIDVPRLDAQRRGAELWGGDADFLEVIEKLVRRPFVGSDAAKLHAHFGGGTLCGGDTQQCAAGQQTFASGHHFTQYVIASGGAGLRPAQRRPTRP